METGQGSSSTALGAYGIRLRGLGAASDLLVPVSGGEPAYDVEWEVVSPEPGPEHVDADSAELRLRSGGRILIDRRAGRTRFQVPHAVRPDELVHPFLAPAAAVICRWLGRESIHAGAFAVDGRAWGVVGAREAGKSSMLAWLALTGADVVCDDLLVIDGRATFTGPRSVDLRADAAERLEAGEAIGMTGARERWRLKLEPTATGHVLSGWLFLAWGDRVEVRELGARERFERLVPQRAVRLEPTRPDAVLDLATLPAWEISRPRDWAWLPEAGGRLLELASATGTAAG